jgi:D-alanyl-D-alanine carboxypeptidase
MNFMKLLLIIFTLLTLQTAYAGECNESYSAIVFREDDGEILFENRSDVVCYPASLVKVMTLYLTFEALSKGRLTMNQYLTVSERGAEVSRVNKVNTMHLKQGDKITVKEAISALIVKSFNEAAVTLAEAISGGEWAFTRKMNETAQNLKMYNTSFRNASGLHEEGQYTTAYDLARLVRATKHDFPQYYPLFATKKFFYKGQEYETHNYVLLEYDGAEGMKTGFTNASGYNLISAAKRNNQRIFSILLGCGNNEKRDKFTKELLDDGFSKLALQCKREKISDNFNYGRPLGLSQK